MMSQVPVFGLIEHWKLPSRVMTPSATLLVSAGDLVISNVTVPLHVTVEMRPPVSHIPPNVKVPEMFVALTTMPLKSALVHLVVAGP